MSTEKRMSDILMSVALLPAVALPDKQSGALLLPWARRHKYLSIMEAEVPIKRTPQPDRCPIMKAVPTVAVSHPFRVRMCLREPNVSRSNPDTGRVSITGQSVPHRPEHAPRSNHASRAQDSFGAARQLERQLKEMA